MHVLSVLLGQPPMTLQQELTAVGPIPKPPAQVAVGLPSELLLRRPDVARSERQLAAQTAEIGVARRDLFPRFFITGAASLQSVRSSDFLTVLVAEESLFTSQDTLAQTERDVALELVALYKAVGGGWEAGATAREASGSGSS